MKTIKTRGHFQKNFVVSTKKAKKKQTKLYYYKSFKIKKKQL